MGFWAQIRRSALPRRAADGLLAAAALGLLILCAYGAMAKSNAPAAPAAPAPIVQPTDHPTMSFENFTVQVTRDGLPRETIVADWAQMDEADHIMTLRHVKSRFFTDGKFTGEAQSGYAITYLKARPAENLGTHDMKLSDTVFFKMQDGTLVQSQQMNYVNDTQMLNCDVPYIKQAPLQKGFVVGRGDGFSIKLDVAKSTFANWKEYGKPAVLEHSATPVLNQ